MYDSGYFDELLSPEQCSSEAVKTIATLYDRGYLECDDGNVVDILEDVHRRGRCCIGWEYIKYALLKHYIVPSSWLRGYWSHESFIPVMFIGTNIELQSTDFIDDVRYMEFVHRNNHSYLRIAISVNETIKYLDSDGFSLEECTELYQFIERNISVFVSDTLIDSDVDWDRCRREFNGDNRHIQFVYRGYYIYFYDNYEFSEPVHVHVVRYDDACRYYHKKYFKCWISFLSPKGVLPFVCKYWQLPIPDDVYKFIGKNNHFIYDMFWEHYKTLGHFTVNEPQVY